MRHLGVLCVGLAVSLTACTSTDGNLFTVDGGQDLFGRPDLTGPEPDGGNSNGWLHTNGNKIYDGNTVWVGRGVNVDDLYLCGNNNNLQNAMAEANFTTMITGLMTVWKPTFVRVSLGMDSYPTITSWLTNPAQYKTPMTNIINAIGAYPGVHVLVTLRSDTSMIDQDTTDGDAEATGIPSNATDATYEALVDTFATSSFVMFGLTNEPGGNKSTDATIAAAMKHAVGTIRAEEDRLGVPHHILSVQGNDWTSNITYYNANPIGSDNIVYEVHGYPPTKTSYTSLSLPVIIGEYGMLDASTAPPFYADIESKQIPSLAYVFEPFSGCSPNLLNVDGSPTNLTPTAWGKIVKQYLLSH